MAETTSYDEDGNAFRDWERLIKWAWNAARGTMPLNMDNTHHQGSTRVHGLSTPIFVVGMPRSGTKWLSNLLSAHQDVASVQNERHRGILETTIFDATQTKFDLAWEDDYAAFIELWSKSDFFLTAGTNVSLFYRIPEDKRDFVSLFTILMNDLAHRRGCPFWLQKMSPSQALAIVPRFPGVRLVIIQRRLCDVLASQRALDAQHGTLQIFYQTVYDYVYQEKCASRLLRRFPSAAQVTYEQLRATTDATVRALCAQLGLRDTPDALRSPYQANTSFGPTRSELPPRIRFAASSFAAILRGHPLWALTAISKLKGAIMGRPISHPFTSGEFGTLKDRLNPPPKPIAQDGCRRASFD